MRAKVSGQVLEVKPEFDENKRALHTITAMIFQKGERNLLAVKKVPREAVKEGANVDGLSVRASTYNFNGNFGMTVAYAE